MVAGSSGAYFYIADTILQMDCYEPLDITDKTKAFCSGYALSHHLRPRLSSSVRRAQTVKQ